VSVRRAARDGERESVDPDDPESIARARERTEAILAADRTFREVLGVGLSDLAAANAGAQVEDLAPPER